MLFFILSFGFLYWMIYLQETSYEKNGDLLIKQIETYRKIENKLPDNLNDLGIVESMNEGPYYEKVDSINYIIRCILILDLIILKSIIQNSKSGKMNNNNKARAIGRIPINAFKYPQVF